MYKLLKIHLWRYGFQVFFLWIFGIGGMYDIDDNGDYFQITFNLWKYTITIQIGTIDYGSNKRGTSNKTRVPGEINS